MSGLDIRELTLRGTSPVLRRISLQVPRGQTHALIGDRGSGKSLIGKALLGIPPSSLHVKAAHLRSGGDDLSAGNLIMRRLAIARSVALIPQHADDALNPCRRIGAQMTDRLIRILGLDAATAQARVHDALDAVEIADVGALLGKYPRELNNDLRRRVLMAAAFTGHPTTVFADAPTATLDPPRQKEHLRLLCALQQAHGSALVLATRDPGVAARTSQRAYVLFEGAIVEDTAMSTLLAVPAHPYSQALLNVTPRYDDPRAGRAPIPASVIAATRAEVEARDV